jgi:hypothetical protein
MRSLNAHLRDAETHDRLAFHPACPICHQTRMSGTFSTSPAVSARTQALVAAAALAVLAPAAPVALAAEPDNEREGTAQVVETGPRDPATSRDFDPGGQPTNLFEIGTPPIATDPPHGARAPVDPSPSADTNDPVIGPGDAAQAAAGPSSASQQTTTQGSIPGATRAPAPPAATAQATPPAPGTPPDSTPPPPAPEASATPSDRPTHDIDKASDTDQTNRRTPRQSRVKHHTAAATTAASATPTAAPAAAAVTADAAPHGRRPRPGDRTHTVLPGESLWSIASDLLGPDATPARVAREVHRLWQLNHDRIATGDPDLIRIGTLLTLR